MMLTERWDDVGKCWVIEQDDSEPLTEKPKPQQPAQPEDKKDE